MDFSKKWTIPESYSPSGEFQKNWETEAQLENKLIHQLEEQGYKYNKEVNDEKTLLINWRQKIEQLNNYQFDDATDEWNLFLEEIKKEQGIIAKAEYLQTFLNGKQWGKPNGEIFNLKFLDTQNWVNNHFEVINQYQLFNQYGKVINRYDVTILINGLPLVHLELKARHVELKEAFNQIHRYGNGFHQVYGMFDFVRIFIISNGQETRYYSNTTRPKFDAKFAGGNKTVLNQRGTWIFTNHWTDQNNQRINEIKDFAKTFFDREILWRMLVKYSFLTSSSSKKQQLIVLRPYHIAAV